MGAVAVREKREKMERARARGTRLIVGAGVVLVLGYGAWRLVTRPKPEKKLGVEELVRGKAKRTPAGNYEILYDFDALPAPEGADPEEFDPYPQLNDWEWPSGSGVVKGENRFSGELKSHIVFEGDLGLEVEFELIRGGVVNARLCMTVLRKPNSYQLSLLANGMAVISENILGSYQDIARAEEAFPPVEVGEKHVLRFELEGSPPVPDVFRVPEPFEEVDLPPGGVLKGYLDGKLIVTAETSGRLPALGAVGIGAWNSRAFFDNLKITGRPTRSWVEGRRKVEEVLGGDR